VPEEIIVFASAKMAFHGDVARAATIPSVVFQTWLVTTSEFLHSAIVFAIWSTWHSFLPTGGYASCGVWHIEDTDVEDLVETLCPSMARSV